MAFQGDSIFWVEVEKIVPNPYQPRREFDEEKLRELSESVRMYGILQPLTVSRKEIMTEDGAFRTEYELIAGERRLRASKMAGVEQVPVIIREGEDSEQEKLELAIIENLQREDLNAVDRAQAFKQLADTFDLSHTQVAKKVGRSREYVSNSIRILALPEYMLSSLKQGDISEGHARTLLMINDKPEEQDTVYREILLKKLSVREVERITRKIAVDKVRKKNWDGIDPELIELEKQFTESLGTRVQIQKTDYGGKVTIDYFSEDDLQKMLTLLRREDEQRAAIAQNPHLASMSQEERDALSALSANTPLTHEESAADESAAVAAHVDTPQTVVDQPAPVTEKPVETDYALAEPPQRAGESKSVMEAREEESTPATSDIPPTDQRATDEGTAYEASPVFAERTAVPEATPTPPASAEMSAPTPVEEQPTPEPANHSPVPSQPTAAQDVQSSVQANPHDAAAARALSWNDAIDSHDTDASNERPTTPPESTQTQAGEDNSSVQPAATEATETEQAVTEADEAASGEDDSNLYTIRNFSV